MAGLMGRVTDLHLRDIRCFAGDQSSKLGRITLLLGENNSGKSTFLGCYKALVTLANFSDSDGSEPFGGPPVHMSRFETIARSGRPEFVLGGQFADHCYSGVQFEFTCGKSGVPVAQRVRLEFVKTNRKSQLVDIEWLHESNYLRFDTPDFHVDLPRAEISCDSIQTWISQRVRHGYLPYGGDLGIFTKRQNHGNAEADSERFEKFVSFLRSELPLPGDTSLVVETLDPQLTRLRRMHTSRPTYLGAERDFDLSHIAEVGKKLGLWDAVSVTHDSKTGSYQVLIDTAGGRRNIVDAGDGIRCLLPTLYPILSKKHATVFLLQQPETYLHASAQAALAQMLADSKHSFLIETHSEHFTDRFRICLMEGTLRPQDVSILYFERTADGKSSQIHTIGVDSQGNLLDVPTSYRSFFLRETQRLMGFS